ncbi:hypothetical protein METSCH_B05350 [Metschnikowia aff. pulcherrima]|uniref:Uncharacterized protein n=1 Tax=Metschnikowia aff. pulcherrima TaxID=2163413 RepID=A0A4V1ADY5_9ASCO|nr:hypothetical protein METSCH_B05350 [Metschnikowia aff. pulcherrima]
MSFTETDFQYDDEILRLARDPNLNKEKGKTSKLVLLIQNFPLAERTVSRLCQLALSILQTLEKIELNLRNWTFMSLDLNSSHHFDNTNPDEIKTFNNNVSMRVIESCQELTVKLNKISADMDFITKALRSLTPLEFLSDSGTLLTSLLLRNIKLKDELREKVTIAYLKAKIITIGTNLEIMLEDGSAEQKGTVESYKQFVVSLLDQLNAAIDAQNDEDKNECLAVISDMEQMFEVFKLEYAQGTDEMESDGYGRDSDQYSLSTKQDEFSETEDLTETSSMAHSATPLYVQPMVHSITKPQMSPSDVNSVVEQHARRGSFSSVASTSILQKSTLSEELPYLLSAFNLAKTIEEDVFHYKDNEEKQQLPKEEAESVQASVESIPHKQFPTTKHHLPQSSLYTNSQMLSTPPMSASLYLYNNNSLLSKLGIKPQVISAPLPKQLNESVSFNKPPPILGPKTHPVIKAEEESLAENKENKRLVVPLTQANLTTHNLSALTLVDIRVGIETDDVE